MEEIVGKVIGGQQEGADGIALVISGHVKKENKVFGTAKAQIVLQVKGECITEMAKHYHSGNINLLGNELVGKEITIKFSG